MGLTKEQIDRLRYDPERRSTSGKPVTQQVLWDDRVRGLGVRVQRTGVKTFVLKYRTDARRVRLLTLGRYGTLTLQQARDKAIAQLAKVTDGKDPAAERRDARRGLTLREFAELFMQDHVRKHERRTEAETRRRLDRIILPRLGARKLKEITTADIQALHKRYGEQGLIGGRAAPIQANRMAALISVMRSKAVEWGALGADAPSWSVSRFPERKRDRWVEPEELPSLLAAIDAEESVHARGAMMLALFTGMRRGELLELRWEQVKFDRRVIELPRRKSGRAHTVPLVEDAVELLRKLDEARFLGNPHVFPSPTVQGAHLHDLNKPWRDVRARMWLARNPERASELLALAVAELRGIKHASTKPEAVERRKLLLAATESRAEGDQLRLHDVRRTTGSMLAMAGASLPQIGKVLDHTNPSTTAVYARLQVEATRALLENAVAEQVRRARQAAG